MTRYLLYWARLLRCALTGGRLYMGWLIFLLAVTGVAVFVYIDHISEGLVVTNMTDQVSWGIGIANFVYFVGVAAAAAVLVVPAYVYGRQDIKEVVIIGEQLALIAVVMCLLFITTDVGRPERMWHLFPPLGWMNLPSSLLAWDVMVFTGYMLLNAYIPSYLLYKRYIGEKPNVRYYLPPVFLSIAWAVSIHTVTAFLLGGLGSRHFWNTPILAPRFLISAGASGPALLFIIFLVVRKYTPLKVKDTVFDYLKRILRVTMPINLFLLGCEVFYEFYTGSFHSISARYLYFGIGEYDTLAWFIWPAILFNITATAIFTIPALHKRQVLVIAACVLTIFGIWTEKGMGLIFPGFVPSPLGEIAEYSPNLGEIIVSLGVLALGTMVFSMMTKVTVAILTGNLKAAETAEPAEEPAPA